MYLDDKGLYVVPETLPDSSLAVLSGTRIEVFGFSFQTPWAESPGIKSWPHLSHYVFHDNGVGILVNDPSEPHLNTAAIRKSPEIVQILGTNTANSECAFWTDAMSSTPSEIRWWKPPGRRLARSTILLGMKSMALTESLPVYRIQFGVVRGFQEGSPSSPSRQVRLILFDSADHEYEITIALGKAYSMSQPQINAMIASLHPRPGSPAAIR